jgi:hypothetical protein
MTAKTVRAGSMAADCASSGALLNRPANVPACARRALRRENTGDQEG